MVLCTQCQRLDVESRVPDCSILEGGRCLLCKEYMELEQKIQELQERRRKLCAKMNANHDPFILKLPPEVASRIFILLKEESEVLYGCWENLSVIFLLGAVCRGWRQLTRSTPQLWSTLAFYFPDKSAIMDTLPRLVVDWLERSGGLPLTLTISYRGSDASSITLTEGSVSIINALNQHSRRWHDVSFVLPPLYLGRLCGSSPPEYLRELSIYNPLASHRDSETGLKFKMNAQPSPTKFTMDGIPFNAIDISWDRLVHLKVSNTSLDGVLQVIRNAPILETCSLFGISPPTDDFPTSKTIIRHPHLRTLTLFQNETRVLAKIINSLELPSLESWMLQSQENVIGVDVTSFLKRSGSGLKTLLLWQNHAPAFEDFEQLLQAVPHLQRLEVDCNDSPMMMDLVLKRISASPPSASQIGNHADFLPRLEHLNLRSIEFKAWECIPLIFRWPHRKLLHLDIHVVSITISDNISSALVQLVDEGIALGIFNSSNGEDYLQSFRDSTASLQMPNKAIDPVP